MRSYGPLTADIYLIDAQLAVVGVEYATCSFFFCDGPTPLMKKNHEGASCFAVTSMIDHCARSEDLPQWYLASTVSHAMNTRHRRDVCAQPVILRQVHPLQMVCGS